MRKVAVSAMTSLDALNEAMAQLSRVRKRQHTDYSKQLSTGVLDQVFQILLYPDNLPWDTLKVTGLPIHTGGLLNQSGKVKSDITFGFCKAGRPGTKSFNLCQILCKLEQSGNIKIFHRITRAKREP